MEDSATQPKGPVLFPQLDGASATPFGTFVVKLGEMEGGDREGEGERETFHT